jgi:DNA-binding LacI/PurR family transcriptional regulator
VVTIKELAVHTGLSVSTVSLVLRGEAAERKVSQASQEKIWRVVKELNYRPNLSARRLRSPNSAGLTIAIFWTSDRRNPMVVRFLRGIQDAIRACGQNIEIIIHPYEPDKLHTERSLTEMDKFNAAIISNISPADMEFLENITFHMPIILHNRKSEKFCIVWTDEYREGCIAAEVFASLSFRRAALISARPPFGRWVDRAKGFEDTCAKLGIRLVKKIIGDYSMAGGYEDGLILSGIRPLPECVFFPSDTTALGALRAFYKKGIRIPEDLKIITVGHGDIEVDEFAYVSLSVVTFPVEKMAQACFSLLLDVINGKVSPPHSIEIPIEYIPRESCPAVP